MRAWLLHLEARGLAPATRAVHHAALRFLHGEVLGRPQVMATVPRPRKGPAKVGLPLVREEVEALREAAKTRPFDYTVLATLVDTGMRIGEACHLRTEDIDRRAPACCTSGKARGARPAP